MKMQISTTTTGGEDIHANSVTIVNATIRKSDGKCTHSLPQIFVSSVEKMENWF
jgi:hypothetical protein